MVTHTSILHMYKMLLPFAAGAAFLCSAALPVVPFLVVEALAEPAALLASLAPA